ncbi:MAG: hypothetical protein A2038_15240 [Deltaproteobacteria bacterium GWA2_57_13]|nr:MAG: hypothetical protein A2038_15240 [Deltaproteobacteria bacterium GWA2_57_13]
MELERRGVPTVSVFTTVFASLAKSEAEVLGLKDFRLVTVRHPMETMSEEEISEAVNNIVDEVARGLLGDRGVSGRNTTGD